MCEPPKSYLKKKIIVKKWKVVSIKSDNFEKDEIIKETGQESY
jgi:hypothetical protein